MSVIADDERNSVIAQNDESRFKIPHLFYNIYLHKAWELPIVVLPIGIINLTSMVQNIVRLVRHGSLNFFVTYAEFIYANHLRPFKYLFCAL